MYNVKPFNCITTPNGTKMYLYLIGGRNYYGVSRLAKALGYSQFTTDSTLAAAFKDKRFYMSYAQISGGSARVADFDQLVPLLEHFIKLSLNITPNSDSQTLILDNARMEAQRLIELLKKEPVVKQPEPTVKQPEPKLASISRFEDRFDSFLCIDVVRLTPREIPLGVYRFNDNHYLFVDEIAAAICLDGDELSFLNQFKSAAKNYIEVAHTDIQVEPIDAINVKNFFAALEDFARLEPRVIVADKIRALIVANKNISYFNPPAQIKSEPVETNLFGELVEHDDPQSITMTQVDTVDTPLYPLRIFKDKSDERYIAFYDFILAIGYGGPKNFSGPIGQTAAAYCQIKFVALDSNVNARVIPLIPFVKNFATTNARLNHINKNIKANIDNVLNILANHFGIERTPNIDVVASKFAVKATTKVTKVTAPNGFPLRIFSDDNNYYVTANQIYSAINRPNSKANADIYKNFECKGVKLYPIYIKNNSVPAIKLQDVGILSPALGEWIDKEVLPMLTEQTAPTPADLDKEIATYSSKLLELEQAKFDRDINELNTQILSFGSEVNDLLTKIQTITDQANELAEKCEALEREREDKIKQFERKQALYKEMFS